MIQEKINEMSMNKDKNEKSYKIDIDNDIIILEREICNDKIYIFPTENNNCQLKPCKNVREKLDENVLELIQSLDWTPGNKMIIVKGVDCQ